VIAAGRGGRVAPGKLSFGGDRDSPRGASTQYNASGGNLDERPETTSQIHGEWMDVD
jgi:hypothetical protein